MSLGLRYWSSRFARWPEPLPQVPGYTLLVPVPGDLPVFLELALSCLATQTHRDRVDTVVIPDRPTRQVAAAVAARRDTWSGPLLLRPLPLPERVVLPRLGNPFHNYGVQVITGVGTARGSHVILHDADLFLLRPEVLDERYRRTRDERLYVSGASPVWDPWFAEQGLAVAATWEMCAARDWVRSFPPYLHMGHEGEVLGQRHVFDITLHPQALTDPRRIAVHDGERDIVHFNYVIATYRHFQKSPGDFTDDRFRLLLVRLFVDVFAEQPFDYRLPSITELSRGLPRGPGSGNQAVRYPVATAEVSEGYRDFRDKVNRILTGAWADEDRRERAQRALASFDDYYR